MSLEESGEGAANLVTFGATICSFLSTLYGLFKIVTNVMDTGRKPLVFVTCALQIVLFNLDIVICFRLTLSAE